MLGLECSSTPACNNFSRITYTASTISLLYLTADGLITARIVRRDFNFYLG